MKSFGLFLMVLAVSMGTSHASLIAHYTFDADGTDAAGGGGTAAFGKNASIDTASAIVGGGSLLLEENAGTDTTGSDGAVSANTFDWSSSDVRSVAYWMQLGSLGTSDPNRTMISLGAGTGAGNRFDVRLATTSLRFEVQSGGSTTGVDLGNGAWYHVTVVAPLVASTVADTQYFVHDATAALVASGNFTGSGTALNTGIGPLRMGDSYQDASRDFFGHLDDVRLYDNPLSQLEAQNLALLAIPEPNTAVLLGLSCLCMLYRRRRS